MHTHTHAWAPRRAAPANPTSGCSSLMKEKITHRQSGSHTQLPALHCGSSSAKILHKMSLTLFKVITFSGSECHASSAIILMARLALLTVSPPPSPLTHSPPTGQPRPSTPLTYTNRHAHASARHHLTRSQTRSVLSSTRRRQLCVRKQRKTLAYVSIQEETPPVSRVHFTKQSRRLVAPLIPP